MPSLSDTDSVNEKRNLDLYPTPHQTLPPLYTETDYKWADAKYDESTKGKILFVIKSLQNIFVNIYIF